MRAINHTSVVFGSVYVRIERKGHNYLYKKGVSWHMHVGLHKTVRSRGAIDIKLAKPVQVALNLFLPMVRSNTSHGFLLSTKRGRNKLQRKDMSATPPRAGSGSASGSR